MITVSTSLQSLLNHPAIEPRFFVDLETSSGMLYFSTERLTWAGNSYAARLLTIPTVETQLGPPGLVTPTTVTLDLANADGFFAQRPEFYRGKSLTIKQGFREVDSEAVWSAKFLTSRTQLTAPERFQIDGSDLLAIARRSLVPTADCIITTSIFPKIPDDSPGLGNPVPFVWGTTLCPMYLVEEASSASPLDTGAGAIFTVCVAGTFSYQTLGAYQVMDQEFSVVQSIAYFEQVVNSHRIVMARQASSPRMRGVTELVPHYTYLTNLFHDVNNSFPNRLLDTILTHSYLGGLSSATLLSNDDFSGTGALLYKYADLAPQHVLHGVLTERVTLESLLDEWGYAAMAHVVINDQVRVVAQFSRAPVTSFHAGNILQGTFRFEDIPIEDLAGGQEVLYQRSVGQGVNSGQPATTGPTLRAEYRATSGTIQSQTNRFLPSINQAERTVKLWAEREVGGVRQYALESTVRMALLELGDLVTVAHSLYVSTPRVCEVIAIRRGETHGFTLREVNTAAFNFTVTGCFQNVAAFPARAAFVAYGGAETAINATPATFTSSHPLGRTPSSVITRVLPRFVGSTLTSFVSATNVAFTVALTSAQSYNAGQFLQGWNIRTSSG